MLKTTLGTQLKRLTVLAAVVSTQIVFTPAAFAGGPEYDSSATKKLVIQMVTAHGGADKFFEAPSFEFSIGMYLYTLGINEKRTSYDNWRFYTVTVDPDTSRAYVDVPHENMQGPEAAVTGDEYWRTSYQFDPAFQEGPPQLAWYHYGMLALPFMTQVEGVKLEAKEATKLPNFEQSFSTVRMTFEPGDGKTMGGYIDLYIDPETHLVAGWKQGAPFPLFPGNVLQDHMNATPFQMVRIVDAYHNIDGIIIPKGYYSNRPDGTLAGAHIILDASMDKEFDESKLVKPENGRIVFERAK